MGTSYSCVIITPGWPLSNFHWCVRRVCYYSNQQLFIQVTGLGCRCLPSLCLCRVVSLKIFPWNQKNKKGIQMCFMFVMCLTQNIAHATAALMHCNMQILQWSRNKSTAIQFCVRVLIALKQMGPGRFLLTCQAYFYSKHECYGYRSLQFKWYAILILHQR